MLGHHELLVVFARTPELGKVKTRLCPPLSSQQALILHTALVEDTLENASSLNRSTKKLILFSKPLSAPSRLIAVPADWDQGIQPPGNLGVRISSVIKSHLAISDCKLVIIGSDSPTLPYNLIQEAFEILNHSEIVLGPTEDGGYYLVGCSRWIPGMFMNIAWGTELVFNQTKKALDSEGIQYDVLPRWYDVDRYDDLVRLQKEIRHLERRNSKWIPHRVASTLLQLPSITARE